MWRWCSRASPNTPYMANVLSETRVAGNMEVRAIPPNWIRLARVLRGWFARVRLLGKVRPYVPVAVGAFLYYYAFMSVLLHRTDEGTLISGAVRVAEGQIPYRDFFEVMGPGTFYWLALFFRLFGVTWSATRISLMLTAVATTVLIFGLARRLRSGFEVIVAVLLAAVSFGLLWPTISHHGDSNLFALLSFAAMLAWLDNHRPPMIFLAGFGAGLTTCFLQPKGGLLFLSFLTVLWLLGRKEPAFWRSLAWLCSGYATVAALVVSMFWSARGLRELLADTVVWPLTRYSGVNSVPYGTGLFVYYWQRWAVPLASQFGPFFGYGAGGVLIVPHLLIAALPVVLVAIACYQRRAAFSRTTIPYWVVGLALWVSELHRKDIMHLAYGSPVLLILFFNLCKGFRSKWRTPALQFIAICAVALASVNLLVVMTAKHQIVTRRGVVRGFSGDSVMEFLNSHTRPGDTLFAYPYGPMYYFLAAAKNPTRYSFLLYDMNTDSQFVEAVRQLEEAKVHYVLWDTTLENEGVKWAYPANWEPRRNNQIIEPYLWNHYRIVQTVDDVRILERKELTP